MNVYVCVHVHVRVCMFLCMCMRAALCACVCKRHSGAQFVGLALRRASLLSEFYSCLQLPFVWTGAGQEPTGGGGGGGAGGGGGQG